MGLAVKKAQLGNEIYELYNRIYEMGLVEGYDRGYDDGCKDTLEEAKNKYKPAISDGLRKRSKECARIMGEW